MKNKLLHILSIAVLSMTFTACTDLLREEAYGKETVDDFVKDPENMIYLVGQAYAEIKWLHDHWGYWGLNTLTTDEAICPIRNPGGDWNDDGYWSDLNTHEWTSEGLAFEYVWNNSNSGASLCNEIIRQITGYQDKIDENTFNRYIAELKVLRSYYYYTLFDCFGRIPYSEEFADGIIPQEKAHVVWTKLITDLEENVKYLPVATNPSKSENYGRATQGLAYALLARLYLNAESYGVTPQNAEMTGIDSEKDFYEKCAAACDSIIQSGAYSIEPSFFNNFLIHNENSNENIFVIVENGVASFDYQDVAGKKANKLRITLLTLNYVHQQAWGLLEKPWNGFCATKSFLDKYEYGVDRRGPCDSTLGTRINFDVEPWGWFLGPIYDPNNPNEILKMEDKGNLPAVIHSRVASLTDATHNDGARLLKYQVEKNSTLNKFCENDFVIFRYADVLYMKAEALLRGATNGNLGELINDADFQLIRTRAGVEPYSLATLTLDELLDERGREFAWESIRRRDLIRYGKFAEGSWDFKKPVDKTRNWFPIPKKSLEVAAGVLTQNEGY